MSWPRLWTVAMAAASECFPVFYNVSPDNILSGCFRRDLDRHKKRFSYRRVSKWLRALSWIAGVSGWVYTAAQSEAILVEEIASTMGWKVRRELIAAANKWKKLPPASNYQQPPLKLGLPQSNEPKYDPFSLVAQRFPAAGRTETRPTITTIAAEASKLWNTKVKVNAAVETGSVYGICIFEFPDRESRDTALESSPLSIASSLFFMRKFPTSHDGVIVNLLSEKRSTVPVWVRLYGVPEEHVNPRGLSCVASAIGKPLYMDRATAVGSAGRRKSGRRSAARVCVEIELGEEGFSVFAGAMLIPIGGDGETVSYVTALY
ncbi:hypothetical protein LINPERHAP1_LOCUS37097 [Linum perenne]